MKYIQTLGGIIMEDFNNTMMHLRMVEENIRHNNEMLKEMDRQNEQRIREIRASRKKSKGLFGKLFGRKG